MKKIFYYAVVSFLMFFYSCKDDKKINLPSTNDDGMGCEVESVHQDWFIKKDGKDFLYGGTSEDMHFDITNWSLRHCGLKFGLGREAFNALIDPIHITEEEADEIYQDADRFLVAYIGTKAKAYSVDLLIQHEVVNDVLGGKPIMAAYCVLADLGAIYSRTYCDKTYTFGLSGYTYSDPEVWEGVDAFVFWDRETESLWWPLIDKGVSGPMQDVVLKKYQGGWDDTTWGEIKNRFSDIEVLKEGQVHTIPTTWPSLEGCP